MSKIPSSSFMLSEMLSGRLEKQTIPNFKLHALPRSMMDSQCWAPFHLEYSLPCVLRVHAVCTARCLSLATSSSSLSPPFWVSLLSKFPLPAPSPRSSYWSTQKFHSMDTKALASSTPLREATSFLSLQTSWRVLWTSPGFTTVANAWGVGLKRGHTNLGSHFECMLASYAVAGPVRKTLNQSCSPHGRRAAETVKEKPR